MNFTQESNRIFYLDENGKTLAEVVFPSAGEHLVKITHTFVDPSLRGQGVASKLLYAAANLLRSQGKRAVPVCSYAVKWFEQHSDYADVLAPSEARS